MYTGMLLEADLSGTAHTLCQGDAALCAEAVGECRITAEVLGAESAELTLAFTGSSPALIESVLDSLLDSLEESVYPALQGLRGHEGGAYDFELFCASASPTSPHPAPGL